jgi:hypothetical protein
MGGSLRAESDGPGRGATFILELPLRTADDIIIDDKKAIHGDLHDDPARRSRLTGTPAG